MSEDKRGTFPESGPETNAVPARGGSDRGGSHEGRNGRAGQRRTRRPGRKDVSVQTEAAPSVTVSSKAVPGIAPSRSPEGAQSGNRDADRAVPEQASLSPFNDKREGKRQKRRRRRGKRRGPRGDDRQNSPNGEANGQKIAQRPHSDIETKRGADRARHKERQGDLYAALDLGTNNCRLLIATPQQPGRFRVVDAFSRIVRLGEGLGASGRLSDDAMDRAVTALKSCAGKLEGRSMRGVRLIATEACRRAGNGSAFLARVKAETGLDLEIVDRETEARLAVAGCSSLIDRESSGVVLFDIGGGSSELALLDLSKRRKHDFGPAMVSWESLPVGVVTLSERHGGGKKVTPQVFEDMVSEVEEMLTGFAARDALADAAARGEIHLLGTSGTVTTLAGIHLGLPRYDRRRVDGTWMSSRQTSRIIDELVGMSFEQRMENPCIGRDRADLVLAGCAILAAIQRLWPYERLRVADRGLREGLLTDMMHADNAWRRGGPQVRKRPKP